ncbi:TauD/TfdA family dioxygenase [Kitasatospora sp. NPDC058965]|uniref:TauD/TfdA family dioxygenase n=1 Tax=Kitasatospora sp. NPDC058965 TaxID=3346682 RepID=UPI003694011C
MPAHQLPLVLEGAGEPIAGHVREHRKEIRAQLREHGAVLLRGFQVDGVDGFGAVVRELSGEPLTYSERSSPRQLIKDNVYTSTEYPPQEEIFAHNENSYQAVWPQLLYFYCVEPPLTQGATPLSSTRELYRTIDPAVREEFERRRWSVVRNYGGGVGLSWTEAFNTEDRAEVEERCAAQGIEAEWVGAAGLRTRAVRDAVHRHPLTGEPVWFNHATFFHVSTLPEQLRYGLEAMYKPDELPSNTYYGDGGEIPEEVLDHLRECYRAASTRFDYRRDDVLVLDNMLTTHAREPFTGPRKIAVAMAEPSNGPVQP